MQFDSSNSSMSDSHDFDEESQFYQDSRDIFSNEEA